MKLNIIEIYDIPTGFKSWVVGYVYRNESVRAIVLDEFGGLSDMDIRDLKIEV